MIGRGPWLEYIDLAHAEALEEKAMRDAWESFVPIFAYGPLVKYGPVPPTLAVVGPDYSPQIASHTTFPVTRDQWRWVLDRIIP